MPCLLRTERREKQCDDEPTVRIESKQDRTYKIQIPMPTHNHNNTTQQSIVHWDTNHYHNIVNELL